MYKIGKQLKNLLFSTQYFLIIYKGKESRKTQLGVSATAQRTGCAPLPTLIRRLCGKDTIQTAEKNALLFASALSTELTSWGSSSKAVTEVWGTPNLADPWGLLGSHFTWGASLTFWDGFWDTL